MKYGWLPIAIVCFSASSFAISSAYAGSFTIDDSTDGATSYWGGNIVYGGIPYAGWEDVHGLYANYGVDSLSVTVTSTSLTAIVTGPFFGFVNTDTNISSYNIRPGDLFLSNDGWSPYSTGTTDYHYASDNAANGEDWEYVISMENNTGSSGSIKLYTVNDAGDIVFPEEVLTGLADTSAYRTGQEYKYNKAQDQMSLGIGTWNITGNSLTYYLDLTTVSGTTLADLFKNDGELGVHWGMTCGNDVIEGVGTVPEPATMILFGTGILGLAGISRRKNK